MNAPHSPAQPEPTRGDRPNILLIVADDLGFSDLGAFGGEIETPHLDALAREGRLLTNFHVAPACSPTRAMLFSGTDHHLVGLGQMQEFLHTNPAWKGKPGYEGYLNERALSVAELLRDGGYFTCMAGKWHLGREADHSPKAKGFERSFALLGGAAHHFTQEASMVAPDGSIPKAGYREDGELVDLPDSFYSTQLYTDKLIAYLEQNRAAATRRPFFGYLAYTAPHWPVQAPDAFLAKYRGRYDQGYQDIRERRLARMKQLGVIAPDLAAYPGLEPGPEAAWSALSAEERQREARRMEAYAGMIDCMDAHIGRLVAYLSETGAWDDTLVFFMSDNGPDGFSETKGMLARTVPHYDNSLENMGKRGSFVAVGPRWAEVSATPFRATKGTTAEGGITAAALVKLPGVAPGGAPVTALTHVTDLLPTLLRLAGIPLPGSSYRGREVHPLTGACMLDCLRGAAPAVHDDTHAIGEELFGNRSIQRQNWKLLYLQPPEGAGEWELHDLDANRAETNDLMEKRPDIAEQLLKAWDRYVDQSGVILVPSPMPGQKG